MAKKKKAQKTQPKISGVLLDCSTPVIIGKEFSKEHAENILKLQSARGSGNWSLSEGQGLIFENDTIKHTSGSDSGTGEESRNTEG